MELRHLKYFVAVAEVLSFTKAAEKLHLAQPSLTRQIHNLEQEIGVQLLNRSKSRVSLTEEGRAFLVDARRLLALASESVAAVQRLSRGETGQLNIAYLSNFNFDLLPKTLQDADLEPGLMRFVAEGLGVTLAREQIKNIPHPGVVFRALSPPVKTDYCIAWNRDNDSHALQQYIRIVKNLAEHNPGPSRSRGTLPARLFREL